MLREGTEMVDLKAAKRRGCERNPSVNKDRRRRDPDRVSFEQVKGFTVGAEDTL